MFTPAVSDMMQEFRDDSSAMASLVVSVYVIGFALGPLVFAPLSETYGRLVIYHVSNVLFLAFTAGCALSTQTGMFVAFRLLAGCVGATPMVLGGGSIADIIPPERRGAAMTIWGTGQLFGPVSITRGQWCNLESADDYLALQVIGPVAGGFLNDAAGWRWIFWVILIFVSVSQFRTH
jgi:MFS family permease